MFPKKSKIVIGFAPKCDGFFHENGPGSFCVILQTDKQTNKPHRKHNLLGEGYDTCKAINGQQPIGNHSCHAARGRRAILGVLAYDRSVSVGSFYLARGIPWAVECMWCCITAKSLCCMDLKKMYRDSFQFCKVEHWVKHSDDSRRAVQTT